MVFAASGGETQLALVQTPSMDMVWLIAGAVIAVLLILTIVLVQRRKKPKKEVSNPLTHKQGKN